VLIFWKAKLVLLSVPKTGTTALEAAFGPYADAAIYNPPGLKHMVVGKWRSQLAPLFERKGKRPMETVAVIREPVDWLSSWWRYRQRDALEGQPNSTKGQSFDAFIDAWLSEDPPPFASVGSQARFLGAGVDHLFRYQDMDQVAAFLETRVGVSAPLEQRNVSPKIEIPSDPAREARIRAARPEEYRHWDALQL
jgi:hypothetical protein